MSTNTATGLELQSTWKAKFKEGKPDCISSACNCVIQVCAA